ncbi:MAG: tRNA (adenosine(37)-N6)-threonylcarbamoyltransferase complex ATPase subunit type 1 TsaE [Propionibacteriaceae bacterium]
MVNLSVTDLELSPASPDDAGDLVEVIHAAFGARPALDPPATATDETPESIAAVLASGSGVVARIGGRAAGVILMTAVDDHTASLGRVSVHPDFQRHGIASLMVETVRTLAAEEGFRRVELFARSEFAPLINFWQRRGFVIDREAPYGVVLAADLPVAVDVPDTDSMHALGLRLAGILRAGDLLIAAGDLGAGKTTLTQGIGAGLEVDGPIISPTFVISRVHASTSGGPALVHVDAYRLGDLAEVDDLDLDETTADAITVVEWGTGLAEALADHRLEIDIRRSDDEHDEGRLVLITGVGERWAGVDLHALAAEGDRVRV